MLVALWTTPKSKITVTYARSPLRLDLENGDERSRNQPHRSRHFRPATRLARIIHPVTAQPARTTQPTAPRRSRRTRLDCLRNRNQYTRPRHRTRPLVASSQRRNRRTPTPAAIQRNRLPHPPRRPPRQLLRLRVRPPRSTRRTRAHPRDRLPTLPRTRPRHTPATVQEPSTDRSGMSINFETALAAMDTQPPKDWWRFVPCGTCNARLPASLRLRLRRQPLRHRTRQRGGHRARGGQR